MKFLDHIVRQIVVPPAFGLDISDFTVKFIKIRRRFNDELDISDFGETILAENVVEGGEIRKESELAATLKNNLITADGRHFKDRFVVANLPEEKSFVRLIQLPRMSPEDAGKAVRWELEGMVPFSVEELYFDYIILPSPEAADHIDLLVTAFPKDIVESYTKVLDGAGFVPVALELESQAISRSLWSGERGAFIFVDLGAKRTSSMIVVNGSLIFTITIPLGGMDFDRAIAERLNLSLAEAREVKIKVGLSRSENPAVFEALAPIVSAIADELKKQIAFYREHSAYRHGMPVDISAIVLSGGDANLIGLTNYLSVTIGKEVKLGNPLARFLRQNKFIPPFPRNESLKYATAIGSALRGVGL